MLASERTVRRCRPEWTQHPFSDTNPPGLTRLEGWVRSATGSFLAQQAQRGPFSPIVHCQVRLWLLPLTIWRDVSVTASRSWLRML